MVLSWREDFRLSLKDDYSLLKPISIETNMVYYDSLSFLLFCAISIHPMHFDDLVYSNRIQGFLPLTPSRFRKKQDPSLLNLEKFLLD